MYFCIKIIFNLNIFVIFGTVFGLNILTKHFCKKNAYTMEKQNNDIVSLKKGEKELQLDYDELRKAVLVLRAINHKLRQKIIDLLEEHGSMTVTEIYVKLRVEQSVASQHLAILRRAGALLTEREGKYIYYSVDVERINQISKLVEDLTS